MIMGAEQVCVKDLLQGSTPQQCQGAGTPPPYSLQFSNHCDWRLKSTT